ncbi:MAG: tetrahydrofolate dehydrogenase/cyclohydrolase catalytic domain-containing protein [Patescibacteria group bacterium]
MLVNGKKIADLILNRAKRKTLVLKRKNIIPHLAIVLLGNDQASLTYTNKKKLAAEKIGVKFSLYHLSTKLNTQQVISRIKNIQKNKLSGIIVQLPLPKKYDGKKILNAIKPELDVDLLTYTTWGQLASAENRLEPPTPSAILEVLKYYKISLTGKHIVVVGRGWLIGKPMANLLMQQPVSLTICGKSTKNLSHYTKQADILISAVGKFNLIRGYMVKPKAIVLDAGFAVHYGKICGDVNVAEANKIARLVTPTPGGIGPITVAKLLANVVQNAEFLYSQAFNSIKQSVY